MTSAPLAIEVTERMSKARAKLLAADIRHLPVVDRGKLVGIVSERDIPSELIEPTEPGGSGRGNRRVSEYMSSDVLAVEPEAEVAEAIDLMLEHRIGAVPVVDGGSEQLVGIISYVDVLRAARHLF